MTLAIERSPPADVPGRIARATAIAEAASPSCGSAAIWAAVAGSGSSATPSTLAGRTSSRVASTTIAPAADGPGPVATGCADAAADLAGDAATAEAEADAQWVCVAVGNGPHAPIATATATAGRSPQTRRTARRVLTRARGA